MKQAQENRQIYKHKELKRYCYPRLQQYKGDEASIIIGKCKSKKWRGSTKLLLISQKKEKGDKFQTYYCIHQHIKDKAHDIATY